MKTADDDVLKQLNDIHQRLEGIEDVMSFFVSANIRFKKGQRVKFSKKADKRLITKKRHGKPLHGTVVEVGESFSMKVLLDHHKHPQSFHHSFFDPIRATK